MNKACFSMFSMFFLSGPLKCRCGFIKAVLDAQHTCSILVLWLWPQHAVAWYARYPCKVFTAILTGVLAGWRSERDIGQRSALIYWIYDHFISFSTGQLTAQRSVPPNGISIFAYLCILPSLTFERLVALSEGTTDKDPWWPMLPWPCLAHENPG